MCKTVKLFPGKLLQLKTVFHTETLPSEPKYSYFSYKAATAKNKFSQHA